MSIPISIQNTLINFPSSGESPNWAQAIIDFAKAVELALASVVGPYDTPPQVYSMISNVNNNVIVPNLNFPTTAVRSAFIRYAVYRTTSTDVAYEAGSITVVYNPTNPVSNKWEITKDFIGDGKIDFIMADTGQMEFTTSALPGINHVGKITYTAQAVLQSA
jgi:hypothetical protein